jgi:hypothetical protein
MNRQSWREILKDDKQEDWEWYCRWLQDECNYTYSVEAIDNVLIDIFSPIESCHNPYYFIHNAQHAEIPGIYNYLKANVTDYYDNDYKLVYYKSYLDAKLDLIEAYEKLRLDQNSRRS